MKKILILAYDFPPYVSVGGLRPYSWAKYFHEFGVYPIVVTRQWSNKYKNHLDYVAPGECKETLIEQNEKYCIVRAPYCPNLSNSLLLKYGDERHKKLRKFYTACLEFLQWFFLVGPKLTVYKGARKYLKNNKVDAIIATGDPFILFRYAALLSKEFGVPWIADYRDPWSDSARLDCNSGICRFNSMIERKVLKTAEFITTVNVFFSSIIKKNVKNKKIEIIPNGYDDEAVEQVKDKTQSSDELTIAFAGTLQKWDPIESVLKAFSDFVSLRPKAKIKLVFYGINQEDFINNLIDAKFSNLKTKVKIEPRVKNSELIKNFSKANALLLFNYYEVVGTKIFEYIALNRKILLCYTNDEDAKVLKSKYYKIEVDTEAEYKQQEDLIKETNSGYVLENQKDLLDKLSLLYEEFKSKGLVECKSVGAERFSRKNHNSKLVNLFKEILSKERIKACTTCKSTSLVKLDSYESHHLVKCKNCGLVFSNVKPESREIDLVYSAYSREDYLSEVTIKRYNELLDKFEKFRRTNRILDVGCGIGYFLEVAKERGWEVYGTEFTDKAVEVCQKKGINMYQGSLKSGLYEEGFFDVITAIEVVEHLSEPSEDIEIMSKYLRKGGTLYITTPNFNSLSRKWQGASWRNIAYPEHLVYFTKKSLGFMLESNGFRKIWLKTSGLSITDWQRSIKKTQEKAISQTSKDEKLRQEFEKSKIKKAIKNIFNCLLNITSKGDSLKAMYLKS